MDLMQILGYVGALVIGVVLGLIGGGGSILTVPVLVYLLHIDPVTATAYSLFVVGGASLVGTGRNFQKGLTSIRRGFAPNTDEILPNHINWVPRKTNLAPVTPGRTRILDQSNIPTMVVPNITSIQKSTRSEPPQYTIQVGAYKTETNANQMASKLSKKGYRVYIKSGTKNGVPLFKVHVDEFDDKKQALKLAEKFTTEENFFSFVTTTDLD